MKTDTISQTAKQAIASIDREIERLRRKRQAWSVIMEEYEEQQLDTPLDGDRQLKVPHPQAHYYPMGITAAVKWILPRFGDEEFTVPMIQEALEKEGQMPNIQSPRVRISLVLGRLVKMGVVQRTFGPPTGSEPHRFKVIDNQSGGFQSSFLK